MKTETNTIEHNIVKEFNDYVTRIEMTINKQKKNKVIGIKLFLTATIFLNLKLYLLQFLHK